MPPIPRDPLPDSSLALLADGYIFMAKRRRRLGSDIFATRLMLRKAICIVGEDAAEFFYGGDRFTRKGAMPPTAMRLPRAATERTVSRLLEAARELGIEVDVALSGSWVTLEGKRGRAYVAETQRRDIFLTWCDDPADRVVEQFDDPVEAINAAARRIEHP